MNEDQIRTNAMINELAAQRNLAWDNLARAAAEIAMRDTRISQLEAEIKAINAPAEAPEADA